MKLSIGKKLINKDNNEEIEDIFYEITFTYNFVEN